jgi:mRNA interferase MazF
MRGEVWIIDLNPTIGSEQQKERPCLVISSNGLNAADLRVIVPLSTRKDKYAKYQFIVRAGQSYGLPRGDASDCAALAFHVRSLSTQRFLRMQRVMEQAIVEQVALAVALCVAYKSPAP